MTSNVIHKKKDLNDDVLFRSLHPDKPAKELIQIWKLKPLCKFIGKAYPNADLSALKKLLKNIPPPTISVADAIENAEVDVHFSFTMQELMTNQAKFNLLSCIPAKQKTSLFPSGVVKKGNKHPSLHPEHPGPIIRSLKIIGAGNYTPVSVGLGCSSAVQHLIYLNRYSYGKLSPEIMAALKNPNTVGSFHLRSKINGISLDDNDLDLDMNEEETMHQGICPLKTPYACVNPVGHLDPSQIGSFGGMTVETLTNGIFELPDNLCAVPESLTLAFILKAYTAVYGIRWIHYGEDYISKEERVLIVSTDFVKRVAQDIIGREIVKPEKLSDIRLWLFPFEKHGWKLTEDKQYVIDAENRSVALNTVLQMKIRLCFSHVFFYTNVRPVSCRFPLTVGKWIVKVWKQWDVDLNSKCLKNPKTVLPIDFITLREKHQCMKEDLLKEEKRKQYKGKGKQQTAPVNILGNLNMPSCAEPIQLNATNSEQSADAMDI